MTVKKNDDTPVFEDVPADEVPVEDETTYIVYRIPKTVDGVQMYDEHRIPMADRGAFEVEHGL